MSSGKDSLTRDLARGQRPFQGLQITATPIGNLGDLSPRARLALENADLIACEDTRHTGLMLKRLGISKKLIAYHDHSDEGVIEKLIKAMQDGKTITLVSDAGTPLISDPGYELVAACHRAGINITSIPGASAGIVALAASGLPCDRFYFVGFLPSSKQKRMKLLVELQAIKDTLIFYETPKRLMASLSAMMELYPERQAVVARELTKLHETFYRGSVEEIYNQLKDVSLKGEPLRGELVLMLGYFDTTEPIADSQLAGLIKIALNEGLSHRDAVARVAAETKQSRNHVYKIALGLKDFGENSKK